MRRVAFLIWKELLELRQDPRLFGIVIVAPIIQLLVLGYAATTDVRTCRCVVADADRSSASRELIAALRGVAVLHVVLTSSRAPPTIDALPRATAARGWRSRSRPATARDIGARVRPVVQVLADGTDANSTNVALGYATGLVAGYAQDPPSPKRASKAQPRRRRRAARGLRADVRVWFNPQLESRVFMVPGILALLLLVMTTTSRRWRIVREKELGTLEQLNVTPLRRWELIVGKLLPYG